jgi:hypothetical protein
MSGDRRLRQRVSEAAPALRLTALRQQLASVLYRAQDFAFELEAARFRVPDNILVPTGWQQYSGPARFRRA